MLIVGIGKKTRAAVLLLLISLLLNLLHSEEAEARRRRGRGVGRRGPRVSMRGPRVARRGGRALARRQPSVLVARRVVNNNRLLRIQNGNFVNQALVLRGGDTVIPIDAGVLDRGNNIAIARELRVVDGFSNIAVDQNGRVFELRDGVGLRGGAVDPTLDIRQELVLSSNGRINDLSGSRGILLDDTVSQIQRFNNGTIFVRRRQLDIQ